MRQKVKCSTLFLMCLITCVFRIKYNARIVEKADIRKFWVIRSNGARPTDDRLAFVIYQLTLTKLSFLLPLVVPIFIRVLRVVVPVRSISEMGMVLPSTVISVRFVGLHSSLSAWMRRMVSRLRLRRAVRRRGTGSASSV